MHDYEARREDVFAFAWSAPMRDLAVKVSMSDVGLRKLLSGHGISSPPQGHWNRVHAGRRVVDPPKPAPRQAGERLHVRLDQRFAQFIAAAPELDPNGPFASKLVPEDLEELRAQILKATKRITVPRTIERPHRGLAALSNNEANRRAKALASPYPWSSGARFDDAFNQRRLRIANALLFALEANGGGGWVRGGENDLDFSFTVRDSGASVIIDEPGRRPNRYQPSPKRDPKAKLAITISSFRVAGVEETWADSKDAKVEDKLRDVVAAIVVIAERAIRQEVADRIEWRKRQDELVRQEEIDRRARREEARRVELARLADRLSEADKVRALVARVEQGWAEAISAQDLTLWRQWALDHADTIDPITNGDFARHLSGRNE